MARESRKRSTGLPRLPKPVETIELDEGNSSRRLWIICGLLALSAALIFYAVSTLLRGESGYSVIEPSCEEPGAGQELTLNYCLGMSGSSPRLESREIALIYSTACDYIYRLLDPSQEYGSVKNLALLNNNPNETVSVDPELYSVLELIEASGTRSVYLSPLLIDYYNLFASSWDYEAMEFDPAFSSSQEGYFSEAASYINSREHIRLELEGEGRVRLLVSEEYLDFAEQNGIDEYIDLYQLKNAFTLDYLAGILRDAGYTYGYITSSEGYIVNLDDRSGEPYSISLIDYQEGAIKGAATVSYSSPVCGLYLRSFPSGELDGMRFYEYENGEIRTPYINPATGLCSDEISGIILGSREKSCSELAIAALELLSGGTAGEDAYSGSFFGEDGMVILSGSKIELYGGIFEIGTVTEGYSLEKVK